MKVSCLNSICFDYLDKIRTKRLRRICLITGHSICAILMSLRAPFMPCIERVSRRKISVRSQQLLKKASTMNSSKIPILSAWFKSKNNTQNWTWPTNRTKMTFTWPTVSLWSRSAFESYCTQTSKRSESHKTTKNLAKNSKACSLSWRNTKAETMWPLSQMSLWWKKSSSRRFKSTLGNLKIVLWLTGANSKRLKTLIKS